MEDISTTNEDVIAPGAIASGASYSNRINPCETVTAPGSPAAGETTNTGNAGGVAGTPKRKHSHCSPFVHEAWHILQDHGYTPFRLTGNPALPDTVTATKGHTMLLVSVVRSRRQVPDGHTLRELFPGRVDHARAMAKSSPYRIMIWVNSPVYGWRYYRAEIGGISYDWDMAKEMGP